MLYTFFITQNATAIMRPYHFICASAAILLLLSCEKKEQEVPVSSVSITQATAEMIVGETIQLSASVQPSNATEKNISWASSKISVATVSAGKVTAIAEGTSTITASCGGKSATCQVTVSKGVVTVTSISLNKEELSLAKGSSEALLATIKPDDATDKTVAWTSSVSSIASVDNNGKVTALAGGSAVITAKAGDKQATCTVTVTVPVESITLDRESVTLEEEEAITLVATVKPDDATDKAVTWSSSNETVAMIENGIVTAVKEGSATITAKVGDKEAKCDVSVTRNTQNDPIQFVDSNIKAKLVSAFDKNGDGELSYKEAASVSSGDELKTAFGAIKTYKAFDEFRFFTGVTTIPKSMFSGWTISTIELPASITSIGVAAFKECVKLETIVLPDGVSSISDEVFLGCVNLKSISIPDGVYSIGESSFQGCSSLVAISIPESVGAIYPNAFRDCVSLTSVVIPKNVNSILASIGKCAFYGCTGLQSVTISDGVTRIGNSAFYGCSMLSSIAIPGSINSIGEGAFTNCSRLSSVSFSKGITEIGNYAFCRCSSLDTVELPNSVESVGSGVFMYCDGLKSVVIPNSVTRIGSNAFYGCKSLSEVVLPESISRVEISTFTECTNLTTVIIPKSVTVIESYAFGFCTSLHSIVIPENIVSIGTQAFSYCTSLNSVSVLAVKPPSGASDMFKETNDCLIYVPNESVNEYKTALYWNEYADRIQAIQTQPLAIDLGLSVKWASFNLGATKPEEFGHYFAWGETEPKSDYSWSTYKWGTSSFGPFSKYNTNSSYGPVDNKTVLEPEDDVAHVKLGGKWRMPTDAEWTELRTKCTWTWVTNYNGSGINGRLVKATNGNSIFLPAAGYRTATLLYDAGSRGYYWSSSFDTGIPFDAWRVGFYSDDVSRLSYDRYYGHSVRPVSE